MRFLVDDGADPLVVPDMDQNEVFHMIDDFYGTSPPPPSPAPVLDISGDGLDTLMEDLEDVEQSALQLDSDVVMHDASSPMSSARPIEREPSVVYAPAADAELNDRHDQIGPNASPSLAMELVSDPKATTTSPLLVNEPNAAEAQQLHTSSPVDSPMEDALPMLHSPTSSRKDQSAATPQLNLQPIVPQHEHLQTPVLPIAEHMRQLVRGSSIVPSSEGHRSSMQGQMREEEKEQELTDGEEEDDPLPFPGFHADGNIPSSDANGSMLGEGGQQKTYDLSDTLDIDQQEFTANAQASPGPHVASQLTSLYPTTTGKAPVSPLGQAANKSLKRGRESSSPEFVPAKRVKKVSPESAVIRSQVPTEQTIEAPKATHTEDPDSSLTDISLSEIMAMTPEQSGEQMATQTNTALPSTNPERKDSVAPFIREFKAEAPSSPANEEAVVKDTPAKPKATPKRKRPSKPSVKASPAATKNNAAAETTASPVSAKAVKVTKTAAKGKKAAPVKHDLKGIISEKVLGDVLKDRGPAKTRAAKKKVADAKPDPALAAKSRHKTVVNYKD